MAPLLRPRPSLQLTFSARLAASHLWMKYSAPLLLLLSFIALTLSAKHAGLRIAHLHLSHSLSLALLLLACAAIAAFALLATRRARSVYMVDFSCYLPPGDRKVSKPYFIQNSGLIGLFTAESLDFQRKILERSGLGHETYFPPAVTNMPPNPCLAEAMLEADAVLTGLLDDLFAKTGIAARRVGILVVNCSAFSPSPSLASVIVNKYRMSSDVAAYNLAGMGCSAGVIAVDLAKRLLSARPDTYALVVSTENITLNWYRGNEKNMLVSNCLFRLGGAAVLLTNKPSARKKAKLELLHTVRTIKAADDKCFYCVQQTEDPNGILGVLLSKELMSVAGGTLRTNITRLGPLVLPYSELFKVAASLVGRRVFKMSIKPYIPNFMKAFEHFCVHAGGRAVLDEVQKSLGLSALHMEPNRMTLNRFGNTSSSSLWYELAYLEAKGRLCAGDRLWQIGFGSGFKCNSAVWRVLCDVPAESVQNCWSTFIDSYPVHIPAVDSIPISQ